MTEPAARTRIPPDDRAEAIARLRADSGRLTRSRRDLVEVFYTQHRTFTAAELAELLPEHDTATIYRALNHLEQAAVIEHVHLGHGPATYRRTGAPTVPAVCESCGGVLDVPLAELEALSARLRDRYGFVLDAHHFALTGRCKRCVGRSRRRTPAATTDA